MILCRKCGHQNADEELFCAQCNSYLEWSGDKVTASTGAGTSVPTPPPPGPPPPLTPNQPAVVQAPLPAPVQMPVPTQASQPPQRPVVPAMPPAVAPSPAPVAQPAPRPPSAAAAPPARKPVAPPAAQPPARQPSATSTVAARPKPQQQQRAEEPAFKPGDRICPSCGVGNDPARKFCRRCGSSLELAVVAVQPRVPWYRKLFRRSDTVLQAGVRPPSMADPGTTMSSLLSRVLPFALVVVIMGAIGSYFVVPDVHSSVDRTITQVKRQFLPDLVSVVPVASGAAADAIDNNTLTYWQATGNKPSLTLHFDPAVDLGNIIVTGGASGDAFATMRRPLALDMVVNGKTHAPLTLVDGRDPQSQRIDLSNVSDLKLVVTDSTGPDGQPVAIRELEFKAIR